MKRHRHMRVAEEAHLRVLVGEARGRLQLLEDVAPALRRIEGGVDDGKIGDEPERFTVPAATADHQR
jgi:hypothetical protein